MTNFPNWIYARWFIAECGQVLAESISKSFDFVSSGFLPVHRCLVNTAVLTAIKSLNKHYLCSFSVGPDCLCCQSYGSKCLKQCPVYRSSSKTARIPFQFWAAQHRLDTMKGKGNFLGSFYEGSLGIHWHVYGRLPASLNRQARL